MCGGDEPGEDSMKRFFQGAKTLGHASLEPRSMLALLTEGACAYWKILSGKENEEMFEV